MSEPAVPDEKLMRLRYAGVCRVCGLSLPAKTEAIYERASKTVRCATHPVSFDPRSVAEAVVDAGVPGASARREFERRKQRREQRMREKHSKIGRLLHALSSEPHTTNAWDTGAHGEERLGQRLNDLATEQLRVLHDRRIPGSRANIDHVAITPTGVYIIDAKKYAGRPQLKVDGGLLRPRVEKLLVGTRDGTKLVDGVLKQMGTVRAVVDASIPVRGVLCFVEADWPLLGGSFTIRDVEVLWPKKLCTKLRAGGTLDIETISDVHRLLGSALPPA